MIIHNPVITGSLQVNGSSVSSIEQLDSVSGSVAALNNATSSYALKDSISGSFTSLSSSLSTRLTDDEGSISSLNAATSSYALKTGISGSFTSLSSSLSTRLTNDESSITSLNAATSSYLQNTTDTLTGDLTVTGTLTAQDLHVQEITSSIVFSSGSNIFGENVSDTQKFTGSLQVSGSANYLLGSVGIGTTSPSAKLTVDAGTENQSAPVTAIKILGPNTPSGVNSSQEISWPFSYAGSARIRAYRGASWGTSLQFLVNANAEGSDNPQVKMHLDESGNVGIGIDSPLAPLHVTGSSTTNTSKIYIGAGANNSGIFENSDAINSTGDLWLQTFNNGDVIIGYNGSSVGIGTDANLSGKLNFPQSDYGEAINFYPHSDAATRSGIGKYTKEVRHYIPTADFISFYGGGPSGTEIMRISGSGDIGIGTKNPSDLLHVNMSSGSRDIFFQNSSDYDEEIFYGRSQTNNNCAAIRWKSDGLSIHSYGQSYGSQLFIDANTATVGIGTTSPNTLFHVNGKTTITSAGTANSPSLAIDNSSSSAFIHSLEAFGVNLTTGQTNLMMIGKEGNTRNSGYLGYYWSSDASTDNFVSIGHWGVDHILRVYGSGETAIAGDLYMFKSADPKIYAPSGVGLNIDGEKLYLNRYSSDDVIMTTGGGDVGIGTDSPSEKLHLLGGKLKLHHQANGYGWIYAEDTNHSLIIRGNRAGTVGNYTHYHQYGGDYSSGGGHHFWTGGALASQSLRFSIANDYCVFQNTLVGIGTTQPGGALDVRNDTTGEQLVRFWNGNSAGSGKSIVRIANSGNNALGSQLQMTDATYYVSTLTADRTNGLRFYVGQMSGYTDSLRMSIPPAGGLIVNGTSSYHVTEPSHFAVAGNGTTYTSPAGSQNNVSQITVENRNTSNATGHAIVLLRTNVDGTASTGPNAGNAFISFDSYNYGGWTAGVDFSDNRNFKITTSWADISGTGVELTYNGTAWQSNSDERLKENIVNIGPVLDKIDNLRCVKYNFISEDEMPTQYGFIAQDWQENFSEVLSVSNAPNSPLEDKLSMKYTETIPILMKAIQELKAENGTLKARIEALEE